MRQLTGVSEIEAALGEELGLGSWHDIYQSEIDAFAAVTHDHQWIHVDAARALTGPYGSTIAHGYLTLSLIPLLVSDAYVFAGFTMKVNYGLERVRFPAPVRAGSRIRARAALTSVELTPEGLRVIVRNTVEIEGSSAPGCVADTVSLLIS
ncbi:MULTISPECIES: MaoC family dehydratase [unclassified Cryobacterium]|uniref:MaoC family dehydratase n=1 Tax=unclassified Cryobacterium TaxID=2649013 RepID=UPI000CE2DF70|nr:MULTISPECIES: MaoC family dehydratase [unclassified Cryobacterium]